MKKSLISVVTLLLVSVMMFAGFVPVISYAAESKSAKQQISEVIPDRIKDTNWVDVGLSGDEFILTLNPDLDVLGGISEEQLKAVVDKVLFYAKNAVKDSLKNNKQFYRDLWAIAHELYADYRHHGSISATLTDEELPTELIGYVKAVLLAAHAADIIDAAELKAFAISAKDAFVDYAKVLYNKAYGYADDFITAKVNAIVAKITDAQFENIADMINTAWAMYDKVMALCKQYGITLDGATISALLNNPTEALKQILSKNEVTVPQEVIDDVIAKLAADGSLVNTILASLKKEQKDKIIDAFKEKLENDPDFRNEMFGALKGEIEAEYKTEFENLKGQLENEIKATVLDKVTTIVSAKASEAINGSAKATILAAVTGAIDPAAIENQIKAVLLNGQQVTPERACEIINGILNNNLNATATDAINAAIVDTVSIGDIKDSVKEAIDEAIETAIYNEIGLTIDIDINLSAINVTIPNVTVDNVSITITPAHLAAIGVDGNVDTFDEATSIKNWLGSEDFKNVVSAQIVTDALITSVKNQVIDGVNGHLDGVFATHVESIKQQIIDTVMSDDFLNSNFNSEFIDKFINNYINNAENNSEINAYIVDYIKLHYTDYIEFINIDEILANNPDINKFIEDYIQNEINNILGDIPLDTIKSIANKVLNLLETKLGITQNDLIEMADKIMTSGDPVTAAKSIIKEFLSEYGAQGILGLGLKALSVFEEISIGGNVIYSYTDNGPQINMAGIKGLLLSIPGFGDIQAMDEIKFSYPIVIDTKYGTVDFTLTLKIAEDAVDDVKAVAALLDRFFTINVVNGTLVFEMRTPWIFAKALRKAANSTLIPEALKQKVLSAFTATGDDFQNLINKLTFDELLQLLEYIPFDEIFDHEFVCQFVDLSQYGTEDVIRKVEQYQRYFEAAIRYGLRLANAVLNRVPDRFMDNTVMDLIQYQGSNDKFSYSNGTVRYEGTHNFGMDDIQKVLNKVTSVLGINDKYASYVEMALNMFLPESFVENGFTGSVDFSIHFEGINRVDYLDNNGNVIKTGFLPAGANLDYFASVSGAVAWAAGSEILSTMPDRDVVLKPVYATPTIDCDAALKGEHTYDGKAYDIWVNIINPEMHTYTWYKNDELLVGETDRVINVSDVADSGYYYCVVEGYGRTYKTDVIEINIVPAEDLDLDNVTLDTTKFNFIDAEGNLIFDNKNGNKVIALVGADNLVYTLPEIEHKLGANSIKVSFKSLDGNHIGTKTFTWFVKNIVDLSELKWHDTLYDNVPAGVIVKRIYGGPSYAINLVVPEEYKAWIKFIVDGVTGIDADTYTAIVDGYNYVDGYNADTVYLINEAPKYEWIIEKDVISIDFFEWSHNTFVYNNTSFVDLIKITNLPGFVTPTYVTEGEGTNVGTYKTIATLALNAEYAKNYELNAETVEHTWTITPDTIYVTGVAWDANFIFGNRNHTISAVPVITDYKNLQNRDAVTFEYSGTRTAMNAGNYTVSVTGLVWDDDNYIVVFAEGVNQTHTWNIAPKVVPAFTADVIQLLTESGALYPANGFVYAPGVTYGVVINVADLPTGVMLVANSVSGNSGNLAGDYTIVFKLAAANSNYTFEETEYSIDWKINKAVIDDSSITLAGKEFVYDGVTHNLEITIDDVIKSLVDIKYYYDGILDADNTGKHLIGTYRVTVVITGKDTDNYEEFELRLGPKDLVIKGDKKVDYSVSDNSVQIEAVGGLDPDHIFNGGITTNVKPNYEIDGKIAQVLVAYDLYFTRGGEVVNLDGKTFNVKLLIPEEYRNIDDDELYVIYIKDDGTAVLMEASRCGDYMCFTTDHFSVYAIVRIEGPSLAWLWIILALLLAGGIAVGIIFMMKARKNAAPAPDQIPEVAAEATELAENEEEAVEEEAVVEEAEEIPEIDEEVEEETEEDIPAIDEEVTEEESEVVPVEGEEPKTAVLVMGEDGKEATAVIGGEVVHIRFRSSFMSRLIQSTEKVQDFYSEIKNYVLSFKGIKARSSWNYEAFNKGRVQLVKLNIKGKTLVVNLNLDPKEFNIDKYHFIDCSDKPKFAKVPMMMKVRSGRALKYTLELIDEMMKQYELTQGEIPTVDYRMPYETTEELAMRGVVKIILPAGVTLSEDMTFVHVNVSELIESGSAVKTTEQVMNADDEANAVEITVTTEAPETVEPEVKQPVIEVLEDGTVHADAEVADQLISDEEAEAKIEIVTVEGANRSGKMGEVNLDVICENFDDDDVVDVDALKAKRLVSPKIGRIKVLARGIMHKRLTVKASKFSIQAVKMITLAGGKVELEE